MAARLPYFNRSVGKINVNRILSIHQQKPNNNSLVLFPKTIVRNYELLYVGADAQDVNGLIKVGPQCVHVWTFILLKVDNK